MTGKDIALLVLAVLVIAGLVGLAFAIFRNLFRGENQADNRSKVWDHIHDYGNWYLAALAWTIAWILVWINNVPKAEGGLIWEPALVALSLGLIALLVFAQIYDKENDDKMRGAIAATFILVFLFLIIDLLTIQGFRDALSDVSDVKVEVTTRNGLVVSSAVVTGTCDAKDASGDTSSGESTDCIPITNEGAATFVEGLFGTFKWALTAIIAFYFLAGAIEKASGDKTEREIERTKQERERTNRAKDTG